MQLALEMSRSESSQEVKVPTEDVDDDKENNDIVKRVLQVSEIVVKEPNMVPGSNDGKLCVRHSHFMVVRISKKKTIFGLKWSVRK